MNHISCVAVICAALLFSCSPISKATRSQVDPSLTYPVVQQDPERFSGKVVLWGGVLVDISNLQSNETDVTVRQTELDFEKRPKDLDRSAGRFVVRYPGFLDPAIYQAGRLITVAGEVAGRIVQRLGQADYAYPLIRAKELYLWPKPVPVYPYPYYYPYYGDPFWGPFWYPYRWYGPYRY